jgi:uncharacterized delta-60 repeat protein
MKLTKTSTRNSFVAALTAASLLLAMIGGVRPASAQSTFVGNYDTSFAAPLGYYVDPENPVTPAGGTYQTYFHTGELLPDGSIIAGGRHVDNAPKGDFYLRKFTASGAVETSFGTGGYVRTNFHTGLNGLTGSDTPSVLKLQPDGKIVFAGQCTMVEPNSTSQAFGTDACVMRYNANGTLDQTFGGGTLIYNWTGQTDTAQLDPGKVIFQTGVVSSGQSFGSSGIYYDVAIQPDGKIVLVGETRNSASVHVGQGFGAIVVRLNPNGSLDTTFGSNGIARWTAPEGPANCFPARSFHGVLLQPDGRIIAVGYNSVHPCSGAQAPGNRFVVTRWTAAGQLETVRHLDNETAYNFQDQGASAVLLTRDASKILVSGAYKNLGAGAQHQPTMARFNLSDLSLDTTFGTGGIRQNNGCGGFTCGFNSGGRLYVRAIQPDGKILGVDGVDANIVRFNPDGSPDQSFGNLGIDGAAGGRGRLRVLVLNYNGVSSHLQAGQVLVRPNGRMNLIGYSAAHSGQGILRAAVSQNTSTGAQNPVDDPQTYTFVQYFDFLNREADPAGLAFWTGNITECGTDAQCIQVRRVHVSAAFFLSIEFQETGFLAYRLYKAAYGDLPGKPVPLRLEEFLPDTQELGEGVVVNQGDWQARLEQNKQELVAAFVQRPRFTAAYPPGMTAAEFVDKLNQNAGGALDAAERSQLIGELGQTPNDAQKRASVLRRVAEDQTLKDAEFREAFVLMQYFGYLRRNPDAAPDADFAGYNFWLSKLNEFGGDFVRAEMVRAFIESAEYRRRFGQP